MNKCPKCGEELEDGAVFCTNCGAKLSVECPKYEIDDDTELKTKLKPLTNNNEIDLDDWKLCIADSEKENLKAVCIQDKNSDLFVSFDLKDDEALNKTIISSLKNLKKLKSIIDNAASDNSKTERAATDLSAFEFKTDNGECILLIKLKDTSLKHVIIPDIFTSIAEHAFSGCSNLESIELPKSVTSIGHYAFSGCSSLKSIEIPDSVELGSNAFRDCSSLKTIKIPSVQRIGSNTFNNCRSLKSVEIPNSVQRIGKCAFYGCTALESIKIPKNVIIEANAFKGCPNLKNNPQS